MRFQRTAFAYGCIHQAKHIYIHGPIYIQFSLPRKQLVFFLRNKFFLGVDFNLFATIKMIWVSTGILVSQLENMNAVHIYIYITGYDQIYSEDENHSCPPCE